MVQINMGNKEITLKVVPLVLENSRQPPVCVNAQGFPGGGETGEHHFF